MNSGMQQVELKLLFYSKMFQRFSSSHEPPACWAVANKDLIES